VAVFAGLVLACVGAVSALGRGAAKESEPQTTTPIKHLVVIFQENVSFDHYFGTYPQTKRLDSLTAGQVVTCEQDHGYKDEQAAFDNGLMDKFVETLAGGSCADKSSVLDYYDGNTVAALWNYAQHFAMSDDSYSSTF